MINARLSDNELSHFCLHIYQTYDDMNAQKNKYEGREMIKMKALLAIAQKEQKPP